MLSSEKLAQKRTIEALIESLVPFHQPAGIASPPPLQRGLWAFCALSTSILPIALYSLTRERSSGTLAILLFLLLPSLALGSLLRMPLTALLVASRGLSLKSLSLFQEADVKLCIQ